MGKRSVEGGDKQAKKTKKGKEFKSAETEKNSGFSLFRGKPDVDLEDVFSKGTAYSAPIPSAVITQPTIEASEPATVMAPKAKSIAKASGSKAKVTAVRVRSPDSRDEEDETIHAENGGEAHDDADGNASDASSSTSGSQELVHEALKPKKARTSTKRYVPPDESLEDRNRRTVFVGNLPLDVATSKSALSQLRQHILTFCPGAKIESSRLRSVPFANPTTTRPLPEGKDKPQAPAPDHETSRTQREKQRAAAWRGETGEEGGPAEGKVFLDSRGKRKVAFIKKDFHASAKTCNAYIVFAHSPPDRPKNLPTILDPYLAAEQALSADGSSLMDHLIRVDRVHSLGSSTATSKKADWLGGADPKLSIFVGGLDYETKEDELRTFFEQLVAKERGEREKKYVTGVRVVRDKDTQLGKGFGYVHFAEPESVDEMMAIETRIKFAKRPIRLQRCKATQQKALQKPAASTSKFGTTTSNGKTAGSAPRPKDRAVLPKSIPKGDPKLGDRLKGLSKDERKIAKASDADRQARRLAKKKLKHRSDESRDKGAVKLGGGDKRKGTGGHGTKAKKGRVRSEHALTKMKGARG